jgi:hypothetical protein
MEQCLIDYNGNLILEDFVHLILEAERILKFKWQNTAEAIKEYEYQK